MKWRPADRAHAVPRLLSCPSAPCQGRTERGVREPNENVRKLNYVCLFDEARGRVRAWEKANVKP